MDERGPEPSKTRSRHFWAKGEYYRGARRRELREPHERNGERGRSNTGISRLKISTLGPSIGHWEVRKITGRLPKAVVGSL